MDVEKPRMVTPPIAPCRVCNSLRVELVLCFGDMPLANAYGTSADVPSERFPLDVVLCLECGCVQLAYIVPPETLFTNYLYTSSTSGSLSEHFQRYARDTVDELSLVPGRDFIVGIGGNDGPLERAYQTLGFRVLNVEPARNIADLSRANRVPTLNAWFTEETAQTIVAEHGHATLVTCNNCFAHMPDIHGVVRALKMLLRSDGWFVTEEGYWPDAVHGNHFDRIYHEHCFYWTVKALAALFAQHGLGISRLQFNASQGGSLRAFVSSRGQCDDASHVILKEQHSGMFDPCTYADWSGRISAWRDSTRSFLSPLTNVACYGVPAKFTMISEQLGFTSKHISYAVEDSPIKVGRFTPGSHIPIVGQQHFIEHPTKHCVIMATNYADMIIKSNPQYKGTWIVLTPEPKFLS